MKKLTTFLLGSCLMLQVVPLQNTNGGTETIDLESLSDSYMDVPKHHSAHARRLINTTQFPRTYGPNSNSQDLTKFIYQTTYSSLPEAFRPKARKIAQAIIESANQHQMDPLFLLAVIAQESRFKPEARGLHGEIGLMQIKPDTAQWILKKKSKFAWAQDNIELALANPEANVRIGAIYLSYLREKFGDQNNHYISAYNMGAKKLRDLLKEGQQPRIYADRIIGEYTLLAASFEQGQLSDQRDTQSIAQIAMLDL